MGQFHVLFYPCQENGTPHSKKWCCWKWDVWSPYITTNILSIVWKIVISFIVLVLSRFMASLLAANHLLMRGYYAGQDRDVCVPGRLIMWRSFKQIFFKYMFNLTLKYHSEWCCSATYRLVPQAAAQLPCPLIQVWYYVWHCTEIMTLVSSENIVGFHKVFLVGGISFMYIMKCRGSRIDPLGITVFYCSPVWEKILSVRWFYFYILFLPLSDRIWTILRLFLEYHNIVI
jgi:hypothetical protein